MTRQSQERKIMQGLYEARKEDLPELEAKWGSKDPYNLGLKEQLADMEMIRRNLGRRRSITQRWSRIQEKRL